MNNRPNILLFLMAGLQADALAQTPNFDRLRAQGLAFRRAYMPTRTCSPACASLMTGLLPHNHGVLEVEADTLISVCCEQISPTGRNVCARAITRPLISANGTWNGATT